MVGKVVGTIQSASFKAADNIVQVRRQCRVEVVHTGSLLLRRVKLGDRSPTLGVKGRPELPANLEYLY